MTLATVRHDEVLETKLEPPAAKPAEVVRTRLLERLAGSPEVPVVAVIAPLGYGKSTLLRQIAATDGRPVAWLTLDLRDDDPVVLISHLAAAGEGAAGPSVGLREALANPGASVWSMLMPRLGAAMAGWAPLLIVLDDAHEVRAKDATDILDWLALHVPHGSRLLVAGRPSMGLPRSRLRLDGRLLELGAQDLAFSDLEAKQLLSRPGLDVSEADAVLLNRRCEGWAAGLQLAVLGGVEGERGSSPRASGADPAIREYVRTEILDRLPDARVSFLLRTSVLRTMSAGLCDAVLEQPGSGEVLAELERSNALVTTVGPGHEWFRYHDLFREALLAELERVDPLVPDQLRRRAAAWHAEHGMVEEAVRLYRDGGDPTAAAFLIGRTAQALYNHGLAATVLEWYGWAEGDGLVGVDPALAMAGALSLAIMGEAERSERWARILEGLDTAGPMPDGSPGVEAWRSLARSVLGPGRAPDYLLAAERACELIPSTSPWRALALTSLGLAHIMAGADQAANEVLQRAVDAGRAVAAPPNTVSAALAMQAGLALRRADVVTARTHLTEADALRSERGLTEQGLQSYVDALAARLALASGDRVTAAGRLAHSQRLRPLVTWAMPGIAMLTRLELAHALLAMADPAGARTQLLEIGDILHRRPGLGTLEDEAADLRRRLADIRGGVVSPSSLTAAELRLVPMLATHLSFREIGDRLFISTNTVKTQAMSVYRKLGATSRAEAVAQAADVGLLDPAAVTAILRGERPGQRPTHP